MARHAYPFCLVVPQPIYLLMSSEACCLTSRCARTERRRNKLGRFIGIGSNPGPTYASRRQTPMRRIQCGPILIVSIFKEQERGRVALSDREEDARWNAAVGWYRRGPFRRGSPYRAGGAVLWAGDMLPRTARRASPRPRSGMPFFGCGGQLGQERLPHMVDRLPRARERRALHLGRT